MVTSKVFASLTIFFALNIVTSTNANLYTYIANAFSTDTYTAAGYKAVDYVLRWKAEGEAIVRALTILYAGSSPITFGSEDSIQVIVGGTGGNTCTYIYGEAERINNLQDPVQATGGDSTIVCKIIVVYSLNYAKPDDMHAEYLKFKEAIHELTIAAKTKSIAVEVKQFHPVSSSDTHELLPDDFPNGLSANKRDFNWELQCKKIHLVHEMVLQDNHQKINSAEFKNLLKDPKITLIVDGIVGSGIVPTDVHNHLLTAIPRAQIRIMATGILWLKDYFEKKGKESGEEIGNAFVLSIDNPSGMNEFGIWTISLPYPVDGILFSVWNKALVYSTSFVATPPVFMVLDITYNSVRLFDKLYLIIEAMLKQVMQAKRNPNPNDVALLNDIAKARNKPLSVIQFKQGLGRMEVA